MKIELMDFLNQNVIQDDLFTLWDYLGCIDLPVYKMSTYWNDSEALVGLVTYLGLN